MKSFFKEIQRNFEINNDLMKDIEKSYQNVQELWQRASNISALNQFKILNAFHEHQASDFHLNGSTGYGYGDVGRDLFEEIWASIFRSEAALVRSNIVSGTHAIAISLFGNLNYGDEFISISGDPYDTLFDIIGKNQEPGSLSQLNVSHKIVDLTPAGDFDYEKIKQTITEKTKMICIQRSRGYSWRPSLTTEQIEKVIKYIKNINPNLICFVDNCYGEFVEELEPIEVGADLIAGSLIKNPGGGLAPRGGYVVGKEDLVENASLRLTAPGISGEVGSALDFNRLAYQGLFMAPLIVEQSIKGAIFASELLNTLGYTVSPKPQEKRTDIIQAIKLEDPKKMRLFAEGIQKASPLDAHFTPCESDLPGYDDPVIMAGGTFIQGSSIELSFDGPLRDPFIAYLQGGLSVSHIMIGVISAVIKMQEINQ